MTNLKKLAAALALALPTLLQASPAAAQTVVENAPDPWVHGATGTRFPMKVGAFERSRVVTYSDDGTDASAGYRLERDGKWVNVTIYVYPAIPGTSCQAVFADVKKNIDAYKGASIVREGLDSAPSGRGAPVAHYVRYQVPAGAMKPDLPALRSDAYLYCSGDGKWLVKYRATGSADFDFGNEVDSLMHAIAWPSKLGG